MKLVKFLFLTLSVTLAAYLVSAKFQSPSFQESSSEQVIPPTPVGLSESAITLPTYLSHDAKIQLVQALGPAAPYAIKGVDSANNRGCGELSWHDANYIPWQAFAQGEYIGHHRAAHVPEYRLRVDDQLSFRYIFTHEETKNPYKLSVGDQLRVESFTDEKLNQDVEIQPDGTIILRIVKKPVHVAGQTIVQLAERLEKIYKEFYKVPSITVVPVKLNTKLEDLRAAVDARAGQGGQVIQVRVAPNGTVSLPRLGSLVPAQGLTLEELRQEIIQRYASLVQIHGLDVTPDLIRAAPRFVYVIGEVAQPGRFQMDGPTTVMQALARAGSWNNGANLRQVIVFRRGDDWRLMATKLDLQAALYGKAANPADEIWLNDSDIIVVPKNPILVLDDWIELIFTRGIYGVIPFQGITLNFSKLTTI